MRRGPRGFGAVLVAALLTISAVPGQITASSPSPAVPTVDPAATTPNVRVTDARGTLVPSIPDADGFGCTGPYLDLRFTITNLGATYPLPDELIETQSIPLPPQGYTLLVLAVWIDQLGTGESMAQQNVPVLMDDVPGGTLTPGQSVDVTWRYRVPDDTTSMRFFGEVTGAHFFRTTGSTGERYETRQSIPSWDLWVQDATHGRVQGGRRHDDAAEPADRGEPRQRRYTRPGPGVHRPQGARVSGSGEAGTGCRPGRVPAGGVIQVDGGSPLQGTRPFDRDRLENGVQVIATCPDGSSGELSDANRADNVRTLRQAGQPAPPRARSAPRRETPARPAATAGS